MCSESRDHFFRWSFLSPVFFLFLLELAGKCVALIPQVCRSDSYGIER
jgi:hypothetical protein